MKIGLVGTRILFLLLFTLGLFFGPQACRGNPGTPTSVVYRMNFPDTEAQMAEIEVQVPTTGQPYVELMMPRWSPGFYRVQDYADKVVDVSARSPGGEILAVEKTTPNRWRVETNGNPYVLVEYRLHCPDSFVTTN